ncbi:hypothetical protein QJS66_09900 [Kocuria rhizophila]|nr:hypothetical protein QJS66_09900 [Kocuria rhizophila]
MAPTRCSSPPSHRCTECGWTTAKWGWAVRRVPGRAPSRRGREQEHGRTRAAAVTTPAQPIARADSRGGSPPPPVWRSWTGGAGAGVLVPVRATPARGRTGCGAHPAAGRGRQGAAGGSTPCTVLYVTGEESAAQVKPRAERIGAIPRDPRPHGGVRPLRGPRPRGAAGAGPAGRGLRPDAREPGDRGIRRRREPGAEVAASLIHAAKTRNMTTLLVGHVTQEGSIAGPRLLEHLVDVVCQSRGEEALAHPAAARL